MAEQDLEMVESPCVRNCCLNDDDICLGCFRSLEEICAWSRADAKRRKAIVATAERRRWLNEELADQTNT